MEEASGVEQEIHQPDALEVTQSKELQQQVVEEAEDTKPEKKNQEELGERKEEEQVEESGKPEEKQVGNDNSHKEEEQESKEPDASKTDAKSEEAEDEGSSESSNKPQLSNEELDKKAEEVAFKPGANLIDIQYMHGLNKSPSGRCGYCKGKKENPGSSSWGIGAPRLSTEAYEEMMNRGWRRCGTYVYKYDFEESCCQPYAIRLNVDEFQISASQKKVLRKFNAFLKTGRSADADETKAEESKTSEKAEEPKPGKITKTPALDQAKVLLLKKASESILGQDNSELLSTIFVENDDGVLSLASGVTISDRCLDKSLKGTKSWSSNLLIRLHFLLKQAGQLSVAKSSPKEFGEWVKESNALQEIEGARIEPKSSFLTVVNLEKAAGFSAPTDEAEKLKKKASNVSMAEVGNAPNLGYRDYFQEHLPLQLKPGETLKHEYTVEMTRAIYSEETYAVYKKYQAKVHDEPNKTPKEYENFLCQVPLFDRKAVLVPEGLSDEDKALYEEEAQSGCRRKFTSADQDNIDRKRTRRNEGVYPKFNGGYHMIHRIDGEIFAIGVLDLTPQTMSSVYAFYDPKFEFLSPGTLLALREIEYIQKVKATIDEKFKFYYMGYYFQDCQKSVYKGNFKPSQVACPHTTNFVYLTDTVRKMIDLEKKPKLYEQVKALVESADYKKDEKAKHGFNDCDSLELPVREVPLMPKDQAKKIVTLSFQIHVNGQFFIRIEHLTPDFQEKLFNSAVEIYQVLGLDIVMNSFFILMME